MHLNLESSPTQNNEYEMGTPTFGSVFIHTKFELNIGPLSFNYRDNCRSSAIMQACVKVKYVSLFLEVLSGTLCTAINLSGNSYLSLCVATSPSV